MSRDPSCTDPASCDACDLAAAKNKTMGRQRVPTNTILVGFAKNETVMGWETVTKNVRDFGVRQDMTVCRNTNYAKTIDCRYSKGTEGYDCHVQDCEAHTFHLIDPPGHLFWKDTETNWQYDAHHQPPCPNYH